MQELEHILDEALKSFATLEDAAALENAKARYLGKEGSLTGLLKGLGKLSAEERPAAGAPARRGSAQLSGHVRGSPGGIQ